MSRSLSIVVLYNSPALPPDDPGQAAEAGVLESVRTVGNALRKAKHAVAELPVGSSVSQIAGELEAARPDVVVHLCEAVAGKSAGEAHVAALLELMGMAYTGCSPECLSLTRDKVWTKRLLLGAGIRTPEFIELTVGEALSAIVGDWLADGPLIVKPASEDASLGIGPASVVSDWAGFERQLAAVHTDYGAAIVERFIAGREFSVGIVELPQLRVLPLAEIDFRPSAELPWPMVTYEGKWDPQSPQSLATPVVCPANVEPGLAEQIREAALAAYRATGCRDYARVDLRVDREENVFVLEVNANPDIGPDAGLARMLRAASIEYDRFACDLVETALARQRIPKVEPEVEETKSRAPKHISIRDYSASDFDLLLELTSVCGVFRPDELEVAAELLKDAAREGPAGHYQVLVAETAGRIVGWTCHGRVPLTDATLDLYWIVVAHSAQRQGVGQAILEEVERRVQSAGGRWLLAETSGTAAYDATREFYRRRGYRALSEIQDFYRAGDGRVTFGKRLDRD